MRRASLAAGFSIGPVAGDQGLLRADLDLSA
jgi:hypothetical protein